MNVFPSKSLCPEPCRRIQNRKWASLFAIVIVITVCGLRAEAQQAKKIPRIGYLSVLSPSSDSTQSVLYRADRVIK